MPPSLLPTLMGLAAGGGALLIWYGIGRLRDRARPESERRKGWWGVNLGLALVALSMIGLKWG